EFALEDSDTVIHAATNEHLMRCAIVVDPSKFTQALHPDSIGNGLTVNQYAIAVKDDQIHGVAHVASSRAGLPDDILAHVRDERLRNANGSVLILVELENWNKDART